MCDLSFWPALPHSTAAGFRVGLAGPERAQGGSSVYLLYDSLTSCLSSSTHLVKAVASPPRLKERENRFQSLVKNSKVLEVHVELGIVLRPCLENTICYSI